ncbi:MAG TPA: hypothetical protein PLK12_11075 [Prolixibacteraceae bacterium]|nr:hypothetical protein [Prolixibacteraceae bacterium]
MKFLALEKEVENVDWNNSEAILKEESKAALQLFEEGLIRELYFDEDQCAVLILECTSKEEAVKTLGKLPLVKSGMIAFDVRALNPYTGFSRWVGG